MIKPYQHICKFVITLLSNKVENMALSIHPLNRFTFSRFYNDDQRGLPKLVATESLWNKKCFARVLIYRLRTTKIKKNFPKLN